MMVTYRFPEYKVSRRVVVRTGTGYSYSPEATQVAGRTAGDGVVGGAPAPGSTRAVQPWVPASRYRQYALTMANAYDTVR